MARTSREFGKCVFDREMLAHARFHEESCQFRDEKEYVLANVAEIVEEETPDMVVECGYRERYAPVRA